MWIVLDFSRVLLQEPELIQQRELRPRERVMERVMETGVPMPNRDVSTAFTAICGAIWGAGVLLGQLCAACGNPRSDGSERWREPGRRTHRFTRSRRRPPGHAPKAEWREMQDEATFARNLEAMSNLPNRNYQIVRRLHDHHERRPGEWASG